MALEEPVNSSIYSGISNVRGWAVAPQGLQKIEMYVDGALQGNIPLGGRRSDVGTAYPGYPGSADSGFAMAYNYSNLSAGSHTLTVRAYDPTGGARDASASFTVARFASPFLTDPAAVNLDQATLARSSNTIAVQNLLAAGQPYTAQLTWRTATQGFALTQINPAGGNPTAFSASSPTPSDPLPSIPASGTSTGSGADVTPLSAQPAAGETIVLALEEPTPGSVYSGISNVRGWAVAPQGLQKIELYVDGILEGNLPLGGKRTDVGAAYHSYPGAEDSGFAMAYNYSNLTAGPHTLTTRAYDASGGARDASAAFTVARFAEAFMADPAAINLDQATLARAGNTITIQKLLAAGQPYNVQLTWHPAAQGFALTQIEGSMNSCRATLSQSILNVPASGGTGNISVSIPSDCPWTANSDVPWVIITSGASGVGSGDVAFTVSENLSNVLRSGTLTIASQAVTLRQESGDPGGGGQ
ncbi:MAG TPA: BACON domain-containing protein [Candidatus Competibacteraceae bacterium]|nr:BACON domain-containing protein [Candidatus Competibacteraceae bacterium]